MAQIAPILRFLAKCITSLAQCTKSVNRVISWIKSLRLRVWHVQHFAAHPYHERQPFDPPGGVIETSVASLFATDIVRANTSFS